VPAAKAAWSRTTPRNPAPASFATVSPRSPRRQMPRPPPGVGGTGAWARRDRMWGRLLERSRCLGPFGEGVGVAHHRCAAKPGPQFFSCTPWRRPNAGIRLRGRLAIRERSRPRSADRSRSSTHAFRRDACSSRRPSRPRRVQRVHQRTSPRQPPAPPPRVAQRRQAGPPEPRLPAVLLAPGEHRGAPRSRIRAWRRPGVSTSQPSPCGALLPDR
jgi:hypothetical protein